MESSHQREVPDLLAPVALQVSLNMALDGKLQPAATQALLNHAHEINQNFDSWIAEVEGLSQRTAAAAADQYCGDPGSGIGCDVPGCTHDDPTRFPPHGD